MTASLPSSLIESVLGPEAAGRHLGQSLALGVAAVLVAGGAALVALGSRLGPRAARPAGEGAGATPLRPLALALAAAGLVRVIACAARFGFRQDDFFQVVQAHLEPRWGWDESLRVLSTSALFRLGAALGDPPWLFLVANLAALAAAGACLFALARRAGGTVDEALTSVALFACAPGIGTLLTWGVGVQQLEAFAVVLAAVLAVDGAAREARPARRAGLFTLALGLTAAGMLVKYPVMIVLPPLAWTWTTRVVKAPRPPLGHPAIHLSFAAVIALQLALAHPLGARTAELDKLGAGRLAVNALAAARTMLPMAVALAVAVRLAVNGRSEPARHAGELFARARGALRAAFTPAALSMMLVALAPFLLNGRYFEDYYVTLAAAFFCVAAARALGRATAWGSASRPAMLLAALGLLAGGALFDERRSDALSPLLAEARRITRALPAPRALRVVPRCDDEARTREAREALTALFENPENLNGLRWATGWFETILHVGDGPPPAGEPGAAEAELRYCDGHLFAKLDAGSRAVAPLPFEGRLAPGPRRPPTVSGAPLGSRTPGLLLLWLEHQIAHLRAIAPGAELAREKSDADRLLGLLCRRLEDEGDALDLGMDQLDPAERALVEEGIEHLVALRAVTAAAEQRAGSATRTFTFDYWSGEPRDCAVDFTERVTFCVDPGAEIERHYLSYADDGARCGSSVTAVEPAGDGCLLVTGRITGCGTWPGGLCRGRGRLRFRLSVVARAGEPPPGNAH